VLDPQGQKQIGVRQIREIGASNITAQISRMEDKKTCGKITVLVNTKACGRWGIKVFFYTRKRVDNTSILFFFSLALKKVILYDMQ
jgi:hypothetical protein